VSDGSLIYNIMCNSGTIMKYFSLFEYLLYYTVFHNTNIFTLLMNYRPVYISLMMRCLVNSTTKHKITTIEYHSTYNQSINQTTVLILTATSKYYLDKLAVTTKLRAICRSRIFQRSDAVSDAQYQSIEGRHINHVSLCKYSL